MDVQPEAAGITPPIQMVMLIYPGMTLLDLAGPQCVLGFHGEKHFAWKSLEPVVSDTGVSVNPTVTYETCPRDVDLLFVPGATDNSWLMRDDETLRFLADVGGTARYVTSVCTGSVPLAAAGLLDGYKTASHWAYKEILHELGVDVQDDRVVHDRNRISGGGVSAGIDFGLVMLAELRGELVARMTQLGIQYKPEPPFDAGLPELAGPEVTRMLTEVMGDIVPNGKAIAREVRRSREAVGK